MIVKRASDVQPAHIDEAPGITIRWLISKDDDAPNFAMRLFELDVGASSPYHTHPWEHEVFILQGHGVVRTAGKETSIESGDVVYIAPKEEHQFMNSGQEPFHFLCLIPID